MSDRKDIDPEVWWRDNAEAFARQAAWHAAHGHPLADIMTGPAAASWRAPPEEMD